MEQAREALAGNWGLAVGVFFVQLLIYMLVGMIPFFGGIAVLIIGGPLDLGLMMFTLSLARKERASINQLFEGFNNFGTALLAYLLMSIFILLWTLLLIIPGIIAAFAYAMTFFIIADEPSIGPLAAITKSKEMMHGHKWKLFCLHWRFFGWLLLCILTLGIGFFWLYPYMEVSFAKFYEDIRVLSPGTGSETTVFEGSGPIG